LKGGHLIKETIADRDLEGYFYGDKEYIFNTKDKDGRVFTPYIEYGGELHLFHLYNNINPLEFKEKGVEPAYNDPQRFAAMIANKDIRDATHPTLDELESLKKYILIMAVVTGLIAAGIFYMLYITVISPG
jgi:hypothetical protein